MIMALSLSSIGGLKKNGKTESKNMTYHRSERNYGNTSKLSRYPIRLRKIKLTLNGHLTITVPKAIEVKSIRDRF